MKLDAPFDVFYKLPLLPRFNLTSCLKKREAGRLLLDQHGETSYVLVRVLPY
jgi:hypothetical protein